VALHELQAQRRLLERKRAQLLLKVKEPNRPARWERRRSEREPRHGHRRPHRLIRLSAGQMPVGDLVRFIVNDVITDHIAKEAAEFLRPWSSRHSRKGRLRRSSRRHVS